MLHRSRPLLILLLPLLAAAPLPAERLATSFVEVGGARGVAARGAVVPTGCSGGEVHDDGTPENGYGWSPAVTDGRFVERFTPTTYPFRYGELCICWVRSSQGTDDTIAFEVVAYDDDGPSGAPGTLLGSLPAVASAVPTSLPGAFTSVDISALGVNAGLGHVYLGARWNAFGRAVASSSAPTSRRGRRSTAARPGRTPGRGPRPRTSRPPTAPCRSAPAPAPR